MKLNSDFSLDKTICGSELSNYDDFIQIIPNIKDIIITIPIIIFLL